MTTELVQKVEKLDLPKIPLKVFLALQFLEVEEHKFLCSKYKGFDVGTDCAYQSWSLLPDNGHSQAAEFRERIEFHYFEIRELCKTHCGGFENCKGLRNCQATLDELHRTLNDYLSIV